MKITAVAVLIGFFCTSAQAKSYTLHETLNLFVKNSPALEITKLKKQAAIDKYKQSRANFFPEISLQSSVVENETAEDFTFFPSSNRKTYSLALSAEQPIYLGGQVWQAFKISDLEKQIEAVNSYTDEQKTISQFTDLVLDYFVAENMLTVLKQTQKTQEQFVEITRKKANRGAAKSYELAQARAELLSTATRIEDMKQLASSLQEALKIEINLSGSNESLSIVLPEPSTISDLANKVDAQKVLEQRPEFKIAQLQVELANRQKKFELGEDLPSVVLSAQAGYQSTERERLTDSGSRYHQVGMAVSIPLFSGLSSVYKRRKSESLISAAERSLKLTRQSLQTQIIMFENELKASIEKFKQAKNWSQQANTALRAGLKNFRVGVISNVEVVQLQRGREAADSALVQAIANYHKALRNWQVAKGKPLKTFYLR